MHPRDCPKSWEYKHHQHASAVGIRCEAILHRLELGTLPIDPSLSDTRELHQELFVNLTPPACPYFAGHYRGEKFKCLRHLEVQLRGPHADPRVGTKPAQVAAELANLQSHVLATGFKALDSAFKIDDATLAPAQKLYYVVKFACRLLAEFLRIHPYANGNGHIGRLIVLLVLARHGYWPKQWPLDDRPPYDELLTKCRDRNEQPLEDFVLKAIDGTLGTGP